MNNLCLIGYKFNDVENIIKNKYPFHKIVYLWDPKKTKMGDDLRIIKTDEKEIFVAYF